MNFFRFFGNFMVENYIKCYGEQKSGTNFNCLEFDSKVYMEL